MSINKVIISGNLTRDAELRTTASGMSVMGVGVAVNDRRRNPQTGEWEEFPNYIDCTMFGARAEKISRYLTKGTKVAIEGRLRWSQWEAKDGSGKRSKIEVIVDDIEFMSPRDNSQGGYSQQNSYSQGNYGQQQNSYSQGGYASGASSAPTIDATSPVYDEEIPF